MTAGRQRAIRGLWTLATLCLIVTAGGIGGLDPAVARWIASVPREDTIWTQGTAWLDLIVLKNVSNFLLGAVLLLAAGSLLILRSTRSIGWPLLYLGAVQFASTVIADLAKPWFGRVRPFEAAGGPGGADLWFVGANSFPSGHVAFYAGLFLPLTLLFPRWFALWAVPLLFVSAARILEQDHYLGDVTASLALASLMAIAFRFILDRADAL
jgi:membrane-associated phospholipid phosphatase